MKITNKTFRMIGQLPELSDARASLSEAVCTMSSSKGDDVYHRYSKNEIPLEIAVYESNFHEKFVINILEGKFKFQ